MQWQVRAQTNDALAVRQTSETTQTISAHTDTTREAMWVLLTAVRVLPLHSHLCCSYGRLQKSDNVLISARYSYTACLATVQSTTLAANPGMCSVCKPSAD